MTKNPKNLTLLRKLVHIITVFILEASIGLVIATPIAIFIALSIFYVALSGNAHKIIYAIRTVSILSSIVFLYIKYMREIITKDDFLIVGITLLLVFANYQKIFGAFLKL